MRRTYDSGWIAAVVAAATLIVPVVFWYRHTGPLSLYFSPGLPDGQLAYVISKLLGMLALVGLTWQVLLALAGKLQLIDPGLLRHWHHRLGAAVLMLVVCHFLCFFAAVSLRQNAPAWALWLPDFRDYYHSRLALGVLALWALLAVVATGILRLIWRGGRLQAWVHRAYWLAIVFGYTHGLAVGSESQSGAGLIYFVLLIGVLVGMGGWYLLRGNKGRPPLEVAS